MKKRAVLQSMKSSSSNQYQIVAVSTSESESESSTMTQTLDTVDDNFRSSVESVEHLLKYRFVDRSLLEAALTHSSFPDSPSYQRLEFVGDAALGLALANFVFITYPGLDPGQLSLLRAANISTEKLARVAVQHGLFNYVRHNAPALDVKVNEFAVAIQEEGEEILAYGGSVKAPKVLADIVESIAAAIYVDCNFDLKLLWQYFSPLLEPIVTLENLTQQPVTTLYELCQKEGKNLSFKHWRKGSKNITNAFVDGKLLSSASSERKETSKLSAAKEALQKLITAESMSIQVYPDGDTSNGVQEIVGAKQKLIVFCNKLRWEKPTYSVIKETGPCHDRRFICSVQIETLENVIVTKGDTKPKLKDAENSAALRMLHLLRDTAYGAGTP